MNKTIHIITALAAVSAGPLQAQEVWRCGNTYSQQPCPGGRAVGVQDERSDAQRAQSEDAAARTARLAHEMKAERVDAESQPASVYIPPAKVDAPAARSSSASVRPKKPSDFTARSPAPPKEEKKRKK